MRFLFFVSLALWSLGSQGQVSVFPASPNSQTTVRVQVPPCVWHADAFEKTGVDPRETRILMSGNKVDVTVVLSVPWGFLGCPPGLDLSLGQLPPGNYQVEVTKKAADGTSLGSQGTVAFTVTPVMPNRPNFNVTGLWWTPSESGWGVNIVENAAGALFATWFAYGPDGSPVWYHMPAGEWDTAPGSSLGFTGPVYRTTGPFLDGCVEPPPQACRYVPFDPSRVTRMPVGTATFSFSTTAYGIGSFALTVDGKRILRTIELLDF
jgi:hypothetical protein